MADHHQRLRIQSPEELRRTWEALEEGAQWSQTFFALRQRSEEQESRLKLKSKDARSAANRLKNRYRDVLPYDHSRIRLERSEDYINASLVPVPAANRRYILSQGPLQDTAPAFWAMVWEQASPLICMLNKVMEKNQEKCFQYFPTKVGQSLDFEGEFSVTLEEEEVGENFTVRELSLRRLDGESEESRRVVQFQFTTWPDFGVPGDTSQLLEYLLQVRRSGLLDSSLHGATVVHCSAGIGRSGTFIIVDTALNLLSARLAEEAADADEDKAKAQDEKVKPDKELDMTGLAVEMRRYRMGLIQTREQLEFTWRAVMDALSDERWAELLKPLAPAAVEESPTLERSSGNKVTGGLHSLSIDHSLTELRGLRKRANTGDSECPGPADSDCPAPRKFSSLAPVAEPPDSSWLASSRSASAGLSSGARSMEKAAMEARLREMKAKMRASDREALEGGWAGWAQGLWRDYGSVSLLAGSAALAAALLYHFAS